MIPRKVENDKYTIVSLYLAEISFNYTFFQAKQEESSEGETGKQDPAHREQNATANREEPQ